MHTTIASERGGGEVARWRLKQLVDSGFPPALATRVAEDARYDLHALIELVERGCPCHLAVRIIAPLAQKNAA